MSLHHFFLDDQVLEGLQGPFPLELNADDAKHARALRLVPGECVSVVDAASDYHVVEVVEMGPQSLIVRLSQRQDPRIREAASACERLGSKPGPSSDETGATDAGHIPSINLVQGIAKGDKMDVVVRQCVEVGVDVIVPMEFERCVVRLDAKKALKRQERWQSIARSAAMQSGRRVLPQVEAPLAPAAFVSRLDATQAVVLCWEEASLDQTVLCAARALAPEVERVWVVIGPEGGITAQEAALFEAAPAQVLTVSLGRTILRTETAGTVACALLAAGLEEARP